MQNVPCRFGPDIKLAAPAAQVVAVAILVGFEPNPTVLRNSEMLFHFVARRRFGTICDDIRFDSEFFYFHHRPARLFKNGILLLCYFSLDKPAADIVAGQRRASFKKEVALMSVDNDCVPVALASGLHRCCLANICDAVDGVFLAVLSDDHSGKHRSVLGEIHPNFHINLDRLSHRVLFHLVHPCPAKSCSSH